MAGHDPHEAYLNFIQPLQRAISCITDMHLVGSEGGYRPRDEPYALTVGDGSIIRVSGSTARFGISIAQQYRLVEAEGERGPWKVTTVAYEYTLLTDTGVEIFAYHWHPRGRSPITIPHLHLGPGADVRRVEVRKAHFPTRRIALEEFLRCVIRSFDLITRRPEWEDVLAQTQGAFEEWRTWG